MLNHVYGFFFEITRILTQLVRGPLVFPVPALYSRYVPFLTTTATIFFGLFYLWYTIRGIAWTHPEPNPTISTSSDNIGLSSSINNALLVNSIQSASTGCTRALFRLVEVCEYPPEGISGPAVKEIHSRETVETEPEPSASSSEETVRPSNKANQTGHPSDKGNQTVDPSDNANQTVHPSDKANQTDIQPSPAAAAAEEFPQDEQIPVEEVSTLPSFDDDTVSLPSLSEQIPMEQDSAEGERNNVEHPHHGIKRKSDDVDEEEEVPKSKFKKSEGTN